jgi:transcriptional regulator with XRE-family HTH domain
MPKKTDNIKELFATNLRENRRKRGLTQEKLAEKAKISLRYLATLELGKNFPSGGMLENLAKALDIHAFQFLYPPTAPEGTIFHLEQSILANMEKVVSKTMQQFIKKDEKSIIDSSSKEELEQLRHEVIQDIKNAYDDKLERTFIFNIENVVKMSVKQAVTSESKDLKEK